MLRGCYVTIVKRVVLTLSRPCRWWFSWPGVAITGIASAATGARDRMLASPRPPTTWTAPVEGRDRYREPVLMVAPQDYRPLLVLTLTPAQRRDIAALLRDHLAGAGVAPPPLLPAAGRLCSLGQMLGGALMKVGER